MGAWYWPSETGPALWLEPPDDTVLDRDCARARRLGVTELRLPLYWDAFAQSARTLRAARVRDAERILEAAGRAGLGVVPVALPLLLGRDAVLPRFAIDPGGRGARCLSGQRVERGAPRDWFTDPGVQEAMVRHLEQLGQAFANHPALAAWEVVVGLTDLVRPSAPTLAADLATLLVAAVRRTGDRVRWTLSGRECLRDQGLRPADLAPLVDELAVDPNGAAALLRPVLGGAAGAAAAVGEPGLPTFLGLLAAGLASRAVTPVGVARSTRPADLDGAPDASGGNDEAASLGWAQPAWAALAQLAAAGGGVGAGPLLDAGPRCDALPYFRANPGRRWLGLLGTDGKAKAWAWEAACALGADGPGRADAPEAVRTAPRARAGTGPQAALPSLAGLGDPQTFYSVPGAALDLARPWLDAFRHWWLEAARSPAG